MTKPQIGWLLADWPAPTNIHAGTSLRHPGASSIPYDSLNLAHHVEDDSAAVMANRQRLITELGLPGEPAWLEQTHSIEVVDASQIEGVPKADAAYAHQAGTVCVVMTADCLPVLMTNHQGSIVAATHAGWRGLVDGILEATLNQSGLVPAETLAWFGPGIGAEVYEVGDEVRQAFLKYPMHDETPFVPHGDGKYLMDMYALARQRLNAAGVTAIYGGSACTYSQPDDFFSYRRDGVTGRMASLIWMSSSNE
ncbi:MAG: peptidoglycan editing factor PgeF [Gammaproteobacteria bacterium]|nr:peptidoglycan editing factor PgeF [Gammaproteobacteria bacterium]